MLKNFYRKKLKNGVTLILERRDIQIICFGVAVKFGAGNENEDEKGIAHFVEHMLFNGTDKRSAEEISKEIEEKGGEHNAFTSKTITAAWLKMPSRYVEFCAELLSDMMYNSKFEEKEINKERGAIIEEIKMYHDDPIRCVIENLNCGMYEKPFGISILGDEGSLKKIGRKELIEKYKDKYFNKNFIIAVVGDVEFDKLCWLVEKYFNKIESKAADGEIKVKEKECYSIVKREGIEQSHVCFAMHFPKLHDKERYASEIFHAIFAGGSSSLAYREIREKRGLAYAVIGLLEQENTHGAEIVYAGIKKEHLKEVEEIFGEILEKMKSVSEDEVKKAKDRLIDSRILQREDSKDVLFNLILEEFGGETGEYYDYEEKIKKVKLEEVRKLAVKRKNFSILVPK